MRSVTRSRGGGVGAGQRLVGGVNCIGGRAEHVAEGPGGLLPLVHDRGQDLAVDLVDGETRREIDGRLLDRVELCVHDRDRRLLAREHRAEGISGERDHHVDVALSQTGLGGVDIRRRTDVLHVVSEVGGVRISTRP